MFLGNEVLLNALKLIILFYFIKFVISWRDVTDTPNAS